MQSSCRLHALRRYSSFPYFSPNTLDHNLHHPTTELREKFFNLFQDGLWAQLSSSRDQTTQRIKSIQSQGLCTLDHYHNDPVRTMVAMETIAMADPYAAKGLLHHFFATSLLPKDHPSYDSLAGEGSTVGCVSMDPVYSSSPNKEGSITLRSQPPPIDPKNPEVPYAIRPISIVNATCEGAGPVVFPTWTKPDVTSEPVLKWVTANLSDFKLHGPMTRLSRHAFVDKVNVTGSNILDDVSPNRFPMPSMYHAAGCLGATKVLLYNLIRFQDTNFHHELPTPYPVLGTARCQTELMTCLASCIVASIVLTLPPAMTVPYGIRAWVSRLAQKVATVAALEVDEVHAATTANRVDMFSSYCMSAPRVMDSLIFPPQRPQGNNPFPIMNLIGRIPMPRYVMRRTLNMQGFRPLMMEPARMTSLFRFRECMCFAWESSSDPVEYTNTKYLALDRYRRAHTDRIVFEAVNQFCKAIQDHELKVLATSCLWLHSLASVREDMGWYVNAGILGPRQAEMVDEQIEAYSGKIAHLGSHLVEALSIPLPLRNSPMASI